MKMWRTKKITVKLALYFKQRLTNFSLFFLSTYNSNGLTQHYQKLSNVGDPSESDHPAFKVLKQYLLTADITFQFKDVLH